MKKLSLFFLFFLIITGCSSKTNVQLPNTRYYPNCAEPLEYVSKNNVDEPSSVGRGMAAGGLLSGLASIIVGALSGNLRGSNVLIGVAAGTAVGGMVGGASGVSAAAKKNNKKMAEYLEQIDGDIEDITTVKQAAGTLSLQCYNKKYQTLLQDIRRHAITNNAAQAHFDEILAGTKAAAQLIDKPNNTEIMKKGFDEAMRKN